MIRTRNAQPADEPLLLALAARLADFPLPSWRSSAEIARADYRILREALHQPGPKTAILIAEDASASALGYIFATTRTDYFTGAWHAHIEILAIAEPAEGRGVARILMADLEEWARSAGYGFVTLNVFAANARARGLYEHLDYHPELVSYRKGL